MKKFALILISLMAFSYAQSEEDHSQFHRFDKKYQIVSQFFGMGAANTIPIGLAVGYFFDLDQLFLIETNLGKGPIFPSRSNNLDESIESKSVGVHFKQYAGNSFYYRIGMTYQQINYKYNLRGNLGGDETMNFNGETLLFGIQIGNQWQWDNFTLGCDWIGYSIPFYSHVNDQFLSPAAENYAYPPSYSNYYKNKIQESIDRYIKLPQGTSLRFYLGYSF